MNPWEEKIARNEARFREINENLAEVHDRSSTVLSSTLGFVCECGDPDCNQALALTLNEFEEIRRDPNNFVVIPGHQFPDFERVEDSNSRFLVIEKLGEARRIAEEEDRRTP